MLEIICACELLSQVFMIDHFGQKTLTTYLCGAMCCLNKVKIKIGVSRPVKQPGLYWDRSLALALVGLEPTEVTAYD